MYRLIFCELLHIFECRQEHILFLARKMAHRTDGRTDKIICQNRFMPKVSTLLYGVVFWRRPGGEGGRHLSPFWNCPFLNKRPDRNLEVELPWLLRKSWQTDRRRTDQPTNQQMDTMVNERSYTFNKAKTSAPSSDRRTNGNCIL